MTTTAGDHLRVFAEDFTGVVHVGCTRLEGEDVLRVLEASGSGWIRDVLLPEADE